VVLDGQLLTRAPLAAIAAGQAMRVPLLIGTNADEGSLLGDDAKPQSVIQNLSAADLAQARSLYGSPARADVDFARLLFGMGTSRVRRDSSPRTTRRAISIASAM
jgi:carboxylesterase type B